MVVVNKNIIIVECGAVVLLTEPPLLTIAQLYKLYLLLI